MDFVVGKLFHFVRAKFEKNGIKLSKREENTVEKGEIARYEQYLLFPVFLKGLFSRGVKRCHCVGMG